MATTSTHAPSKATPGTRTAELFRHYRRRLAHMYNLEARYEEDHADAEAKVERAEAELVKHLHDELGLPDEDDELGEGPGVVIGDELISWTWGGSGDDRRPMIQRQRVIGILPATKDPEEPPAEA